MYLLLGHELPRWVLGGSVAERVREGRSFLTRIAGVDLAYDPQAWHDHLVAADDDLGGYRWSNIHRRFPREIRRALADPEWRAAVAWLQAFRLDPRWRTADVVAVARGIAEDEGFDRLPLLADALMDAGCDEPVVLDHCRRAARVGYHSWVVDLLLEER
jgi:hypothetical protein